MKVRILPFLLALLMLCSAASASGSLQDTYPDHLLLDDMNEGTCQKLTGVVPLVVVFVSIGDEPWTNADVSAMQQEFYTATHMLRIEAAGYGADLNLSLRYHFTSMPTPPDMHKSAVWVDAMLETLPDLAPRSRGGSWRETPLVIVCSTEGRAYTHSFGSADVAEYVMLYQDDDSATIRHELLHLYGATDYYVEPTLEAAAQQHCPDSIMLDSTYANTVDEVTAYVVGWTARPGNAGLQLLAATSSVTADNYTDSQTANQITGMGEVTNSDHTYSGMMQDGIYHGWGILTWESGDVYAGFWENGVRHGQGSYTWADGTCYTGDFTNGTRTGQGTTTWPSGNSYSGSYLDGNAHGKGVFTWVNGDVYIGEYQSGSRNGQGSTYWADGNRHTGSYLNGRLHGPGVYYWTNGDVYIGDFADGMVTGEGVLTKADGSVYSGSFLNSSYNGTGVLITADGSSYSGDFADGKFHGTGVCIWADGSSFSGQFRQGKRHGQGVYHAADGRILEGVWENDAYVSGSDD